MEIINLEAGTGFRVFCGLMSRWFALGIACAQQIGDGLCSGKKLQGFACSR